MTNTLDISENRVSELGTVDPELDRLYREHAIAVALSAQFPQPPNNEEVEREPNHLEPLNECSSTFSELE